jgi:predicted deacetylase
MSVDDVHPNAPIAEEPLGNVAKNALAHLEWLTRRHPLLRVTLFTTPDWRSRSAAPARSWRSRLPIVRHAFHASEVLPRGTLRLDRHLEFTAWLRHLRNVDFGIHGLYHVRRGPAYLQEYAECSARRCRQMIVEARRIMTAAGLPIVAGITPPAWTAPPALLTAMAGLDMAFISSARDLDTPIAPGALTRGSGLRDVSLITPQFLPFGRLVHISTNFQATSSIDRAMAILECGGLLGIKAHLLKRFGSYVALDGLDEQYVEYLDRLCERIQDRYGDRVWWTTMSEIAERMRTLQSAGPVPAEAMKAAPAEVEAEPVRAAS